MGLDIYFHKRKFSRHNPNEPIGKNDEGRDTFEDMGEEIAYFRKVNFLMSYFNYLDGEDDNCYYKEIERDEMGQLVEDCSQVLLHRNSIMNGKYDNPLQPISGFFFGSTDIDEYFFMDVEDVRDQFLEILDNLSEDEQVFMYCWW